MKQRTRIAVAIMIGLYSWNFFAALASVLMEKSRGTLFETAEFAFGAILGALLNAAIVIGCIYLLKNRRWAWTMLVWLTAAFTLGMLSTGLSMVTDMTWGSSTEVGSTLFPWLMVFLPIPFGWVSIPALIILLTDKPVGWRKPKVIPVSSTQVPGDLKRRTRVIAWIYLVVSGMRFFSLPLYMVMFRDKPGSWLSGLPEAFLWVLWLGLMQKRIWSWWSLVATYAGLSMWYVWSIAHAPAYYAAHHKVVAQPWHAMLPGAVTLILMLLIPLWALLTDRPSGWTIPPSSAAKASADKSEIRNPRSEMR